MKLWAGVAATRAGARRAAWAEESRTELHEFGFQVGPLELQALVDRDGERRHCDRATPGIPCRDPSRPRRPSPLPRMASQAGIQAEVDPAQHRLRRRGQKVVDPDVDAVARRAVGGPRRTAKAAVDRGRICAVARLGRTDQALLGLGRPIGLVAAAAARGQLEKTDAMPSSTVRNQKPHPSGVAGYSGDFEVVLLASAPARWRRGGSRRTFPVRSSMPMHLTVIISPILTTSSVRRTVGQIEMCTRPSFPGCIPRSSRNP